ncbi:MAG: hypothetical protein Q8P51_13730 [Ignavibacteria bacterium]|nr:hypothetical protein [Ignavibacteria bacterium]
MSTLISVPDVMTLVRNILVVWFLLAVIVAVGETVKLEGEPESFASILISETSAC